jgi:hypothetical protein
MSEAAAEIKALGDSIEPGITFDLDACESLTIVPKMFRKMALKTIIKAAKANGLTVITKEFAESQKPGG